MVGVSSTLHWPLSFLLALRFLRARDSAIGFCTMVRSSKGNNCVVLYGLSRDDLSISPPRRVGGTVGKKAVGVLSLCLGPLLKGLLVVLFLESRQVHQEYGSCGSFRCGAHAPKVSGHVWHWKPGNTPPFLEHNSESTTARSGVSTTRAF